MNTHQRNILKLLLLPLLVVLFPSCTSTSTTGNGVKTVPNNTFYLYSERELDDYKIHDAITNELTTRGYRVIDQKDTAPPQKVTGNVISYLDDWRWDVVMYLDKLTIRIKDGRTSEVLAVTESKTKGLHGYPNSAKVVTELFAEMEAKGLLPRKN